jgi:LytS/YehU family sensor histidine kinase
VRRRPAADRDAADGDVERRAGGHTALHAVTGVLPHLRNGLTPDSAAKAAAPLIVGERHVGILAAFYDRGGRLRAEDVRVVEETAGLVSAQLAIAEVAERDERLAEAELRALRAQISPHFVYNALAAVASFIHTRPEDARELLIEFAEFTRYAGEDRDHRPRPGP